MEPPTTAAAPDNNDAWKPAFWLSGGELCERLVQGLVGDEVATFFTRMAQHAAREASERRVRQQEVDPPPEEGVQPRSSVWRTFQNRLNDADYGAESERIASRVQSQYSALDIGQLISGRVFAQAVAADAISEAKGAISQIVRPQVELPNYVSVVMQNAARQLFRRRYLKELFVSEDGGRAAAVNEEVVERVVPAAVKQALDMLLLECLSESGDISVQPVAGVDESRLAPALSVNRESHGSDTEAEPTAPVESKPPLQTIQIRRKRMRVRPPEPEEDEESASDEEGSGSGSGSESEAGSEPEAPEQDEGRQKALQFLRERQAETPAPP